MKKKKVNYKKEYCDYFGVHSFIFDEYEFIVNHRKVRATKIHHILFGANKIEHITNWMALSLENHDKAHDEKLNRYDLEKIHLEFMENSPY